MALIQGKNGLCPFPICLAPGQNFLQYMSDQSESVFSKHRDLRLADKEKLFKESSLQLVKVCTSLDF